MTPEEKAKELIEKFMNGIWENGNPNHVKEHATQCAIIAVEEILNEQVKVDYLTDAAYIEQKSYWNEVLNHLKNKS